MKNEFLNELRKYAEQNQVDPEILVEKYSKRFDLGLEAGFTEEEVISKFGDPEMIVKDYAKTINQTAQTEKTQSCEDKKEYVKKKFLLFELDHKNVVVKLIASDNDAVKYQVEDDAPNPVKVVIMPEGFDIRPSNYFIKNDSKCVVTLFLNKNYKFETVDFDIKEGCVDTTDFTIYADKVNFDNYNGILNIGNIIADKVCLKNAKGDFSAKLVNSKKIDIDDTLGDIDVESLVSDSLVVKTLSGNLTFASMLCEKGKFSTLDGKIHICGEVKDYTANAVTGEIKINSETVSDNLSNKGLKSFADFTVDGFLDLNLLSDELKSTLDEVKKNPSEAKQLIQSFVERMKNKK